jgi:hypothetical protein
MRHRLDCEPFITQICWIGSCGQNIEPDVTVLSDHVDSTDPRSYKTLFHEDDLPGVLSAWQHSLLTTEDFNFPYRISSSIPTLSTVVAGY